MTTMSHVMTEDEKTTRATVKALHQRVHAHVREMHREGGQDHRYAILAWTYVRGLPMRRAEGRHREQGLFTHHKPAVIRLWQELVELGAIPGHAAITPAARAATPAWRRMIRFPLPSPEARQALDAWLDQPMTPKPVPQPKVTVEQVKPASGSGDEFAATLGEVSATGPTHAQAIAAVRAKVAAPDGAVVGKLLNIRPEPTRFLTTQPLTTAG
jgi:hypothetical protein